MQATYYKKSKYNVLPYLFSRVGGTAPAIRPGHVAGRTCEDRPHPETPWPHQRAPSGSRGSHG